MWLLILGYQNFLASAGAVQKFRELSTCVFEFVFGKRQFWMPPSFVAIH